MGCLIISALFFSPRLVLFFAWLLNFFATASPWETRMWPVLGFFFMPWTTLTFGLAHVYGTGDFTGGWLIALIVSILFDLGTNGSVSSSKKKRS